MIKPDLPSGTVTFIFTDIEGSTALWERDPEAMQRAFARQEAIVREAMAAHGGYVYKMIGDAFQVAFATAPAALAAALAAQRALHAEPWGPIGALKVRMALHTAVTQERGDDYVGPELNRIARLLAAAYGGQVLLSQSTADLVRDHWPEGAALRDLGEHSLKDLIRPERIYQLVAQGLPEAFPPLKAFDVRPHNLPLPATPFVGRERELARIEALLQDAQCRLISLVGPGGSGKTRLAIQAALQAVTQGADGHAPPAFPGGAYFVDLAPVSTPEAVISAIADALGMSFYVPPGSTLTVEGAQAQLLGYLANRDVLLVLDNVEQVLAEQLLAEHLDADPRGSERLVDLIAGLLAGAPGVKLVATSRERLNLPGEWVLEVSGLSFPADCGEEAVSQYAAVQLFVQGAQRAGSFAAAPSDWPAIARICQLVGGLPLGVEMAAAWTRVLSCREIAADLERNLLALIASWRTVPERHRTLRILCDHSWRLLSGEERDVFCRLSVFRSSFSREAAAEIAGAALALLSALIDKSLLTRSPAGRFELHPVLRQYAAEKLVADRAVHTETHARHARYYAAWLGLMNEQLKGGEQLAALAALRAETENLHDAWQWLIEQRDLERLHGLLPAMILFHDMGGRPVGAQEIIRLLLGMLRALGHVPGGGVRVAATDVAGAMTPADASLLALTLAALRHFSQALGRQEQTNAYQRENLDIAQRLPEGAPGCDPAEKGYTLLLNSIGPGSLTAQQSVDLCQQSVDIFCRLGDAWGTALSQLVLGDSANWGGVDAELARRSYQASLESFDRLGNDWGRAMCLNGLAMIEYRAGHLAEAYRMGCESLDTYCRMGDAWRAVFVRSILVEIAEGLGAFDEARRHLEANLDHFSRMGAFSQQDECRERLARLDERARAAASDRAPDLREEGASTAAHSPAPSIVRPSALTDDLVEPLSARELEILHLLAEGLTNREIAQQLYLSPNTVRVHTFHIYGKLGVNNRTQAAARARELGLLSTS